MGDDMDINITFSSAPSFDMLIHVKPRTRHISLEMPW